MKISVIIPVWNGENYVAESIRSALDQTLPPDEVIVVDDGSTDRTPEIVRRFTNVRMIQQENASPGPARNAGVAASHGEWLAFLDADDVWVPNKLEIQVGGAAAHPEAEAVLGMVQNFISPELSPAAKALIECPAAPLSGYTPSALMIHREAFLNTGGWPNSERQGVEWFAYARASGLRFLDLPEVVTRRRLHQSNRTRLRRDFNRDYARIAREMLMRKRKGEAHQVAQSACELPSFSKS